MATASVAFALAGCSQFEPRDKRFYYRALWNFSLRIWPNSTVSSTAWTSAIPICTNLLLTGGQDVPAIEERARKQTLAFIATETPTEPERGAIADLREAGLARAELSFDEAHALHRATYDIAVSDEPGQRIGHPRCWPTVGTAPRSASKRLDRHRLDQFPYSKAFRTRFPLFNATIWSYHYLQVAVYDPLQAARDLAAKTQAVRPILATYRRYLEQPPVQWTFMPLTAELSPQFAARYPELANIFDNLHMLHDNISDILTSERLPTWEAKRAEIYRLLNHYYLASADATNPMVVQGQEHHH